MFTTLISASELASHSPDQLVIVDCRHDLLDLAAGRAAYEAGHIAGAVFADMEHELSGPKRDAAGVFQGRHPLPAPADLLALLRRWGVSDATQVVAYDAHAGMYAARLWWLLRSLGHEAVAVLDGGLPAWTAALTTAPPPAKAPGTITARPALVGTVDAATLLANLDTLALTVVDARAPDRFRGENETIDPVGGHIPGAINRFFKDNLAADGRFKDPATLRAELALVGDPARAVMQCGSGVTACHNLLALAVAGMPGAALYPGSWSEWSADPARPVARG
ncbi:sulfurtransferase [Massilia sp. DWR3-1-1]|uniref:sulfurtransferase n=1 Tax=Massilia sp. DWR3-1-1 TaxID=2804559 RepID=UPI003CEEB19B